MNQTKTEAILTRIDALLDPAHAGSADAHSHALLAEALQGALRLAEVLYGPTNVIKDALVRAVHKADAMQVQVKTAHAVHVWPAVQGALRTMKADVQAGLVDSLERRAVGEVLADLLDLAKEATKARPEGGKNVAAVLTAAAYEDTIRKLGAAKVNVRGRPDLSRVLEKLKDQQVLVGPPFVTAQSYLKFRNDALHADWANIDRAVVGSCIAFVEGLILQHFS